MEKCKIGVVHGRFQPIHLDHLKYILAAFHRSELLFMGITNPDPTKSSFHESDPNRSKQVANPLTYWERAMLIQATMQEVGIDSSKFCTVPFPINKPEMLRYYVPLNARYFITIYDDWGRHKRNTLMSLGLDVDVLWEKDITQKGITGTFVRNRIATGEAWETLVPRSVARIMKENSLDIRIRELYSTSQ